MTINRNFRSFGLFGKRKTLPEMDKALKAAAEWLGRAQDATPDDGVSAFYDAGKKKWAGSYPETTGYIIPTLYDYAAYAGAPEYANRALRMATWEREIQLSDGGVMAGTLDAETIVPTIFNTGQVLFGWARAFEETGDIRFRESLTSACDWLLSVQDEDGAWRSHASPFASDTVKTYNTRVAYGLAEAARVLNKLRYLDAAKRNVEWALTQVRENGWIENNDLEDNNKPLTHTIAYAIRGILEVGVLAGETRFIDRAMQSAQAVASTQRSDGALPGRLDEEWHASVKWSCLTGNAQMSIIWLRLADLGVGGNWHNHAARALDFTRGTHCIEHRNTSMRGGIAGSKPFSGGYMQRRFPNWAAKFYMDALMLLAKTG